MSSFLIRLGYVFCFIQLLTSISTASLKPRASKDQAAQCPKTWAYENGQGQWDGGAVSEFYSLWVNAWNINAGTSDSKQSVTCNGVGPKGLQWSTEFSWKPKSDDAKNQVKSYMCGEAKNETVDLIYQPFCGSDSSASVTVPSNLALKNINAITTTWDWTLKLKGETPILNVALDIWLAKEPSCKRASVCNSYEIMLWGSAVGGALPIGSKIGKSTEIQGCKLDAYLGEVKSEENGKSGSWKVVSLLAQEKCQLKEADVGKLIRWVMSEYKIEDTQYLTSFEAGTEVFQGAGTVTTDAYSVKFDVKK